MNGSFDQNLIFESQATQPMPHRIKASNTNQIPIKVDLWWLLVTMHHSSWEMECHHSSFLAVWSISAKFSFSKFQNLIAYRGFMTWAGIIISLMTEKTNQGSRVKYTTATKFTNNDESDQGKTPRACLVLKVVSVSFGHRRIGVHSSGLNLVFKRPSRHVASRRPRGSGPDSDPSSDFHRGKERLSTGVLTTGGNFYCWGLNTSSWTIIRD